MNKKTESIEVIELRRQKANLEEKLNSTKENHQRDLKLILDRLEDANQKNVEMRIKIVELKKKIELLSGENTGK